MRLPPQSAEPTLSSRSCHAPPLGQGLSLGLEKGLRQLGNPVWGEPLQRHASHPARRSGVCGEGAGVEGGGAGWCVCVVWGWGWGCGAHFFCLGAWCSTAPEAPRLAQANGQHLGRPTRTACCACTAGGPACGPPLAAVLCPALQPPKECKTYVPNLLPKGQSGKAGQQARSRAARTAPAKVAGSSLLLRPCCSVHALAGSPYHAGSSCQSNEAFACLCAGGSQGLSDGEVAGIVVGSVAAVGEPPLRQPWLQPRAVCLLHPSRLLQPRFDLATWPNEARQRPAGYPQSCYLHALCAATMLLVTPPPLHTPLAPAALAALPALVALWRRRDRSAKVRLDKDCAAKAGEFDLEGITGKQFARLLVNLSHLARPRLGCNPQYAQCAEAIKGATRGARGPACNPACKPCCGLPALQPCSLSGRVFCLSAGFLQCLLPGGWRCAADSAIPTPCSKDCRPSNHCDQRRMLLLQRRQPGSRPELRGDQRFGSDLPAKPVWPAATGCLQGGDRGVGGA